MNKVLLGANDKKQYIYTNMLNRHGLIAGATGTGKTITLKVIAEQLSDLGIPVFLSDVKGDLASLSKQGEMDDKLLDRIKKLELEDFDFDKYPVEFWDIFEKSGLPVRATISQMGPMMLSRLLGLNDTQQGIMNIVFKVADDNGLLLLDLKDLKAVLSYVNDHRKELQNDYGNISTSSVGAILRSLLLLETEGAEDFFAEPSLDVLDFLRTDKDGKGIVNILSAEKLFKSPKLYSTFLLWMLTEIYESLEEVGDLDQPKFVFFFDEAHLIFDDAPKALLGKIELIVRLIRSKGVGVFFITQNPTDIPDTVLAQLGNRVQHALRAYTPKEKKVIKAVSETFRQREDEDLESQIMELSVGEAIVSTLDPEGIPSYACRILICPPKSAFGTIEASERLGIINSSNLFEKYSQRIDSESAYELLQLKAQKSELSEDDDEINKKMEELKKREKELIEKQKSKSTGRRTDSNFDRFTKNMMSTVGREFGRVLFRGIFGNLKK
ncbi:MAG: DUF853 family protein [Tissierellia bacterium]|nr:DUF853 family protein [Tissierellia bacterium]